MTAVVWGIGQEWKKLKAKLFFLTLKIYRLLRSSAAFKNTLGLI